MMNDGYGLALVLEGLLNESLFCTGSDVDFFCTALRHAYCLQFPL